MSDLIEAKYQDLAVHFTDEAWFNATEVAERFGKRPIDWLRLPDTARYLEALCRKSEVGKSHFTLTKKGNSKKFTQGTWLHPRLAVAFARWLDVDFAVWCDEQIDQLIRGKHPHYDWKRLRHEATSTYKVMGQILQMTRADQGKETAPHHYMNEARMVNRALTGEWRGLDRESLAVADLDLSAKLEERNIVLLGRGLNNDQRKLLLEQFSTDWRIRRALPVGTTVAALEAP